jgi:hypothetical protein
MLKFELTEEDVKLLSEALFNMPFGRIVNLVGKLQLQLNTQKEGSANSLES